MSGLVQTLTYLAKLSLEDPRKAARTLLALDIPVPARTLGLMLMAVASAAIAHLNLMLLPSPEDPVTAFVLASPLRAAVMQWVAMALSVVVIYFVGRMRGGTGSLSDTLLIVVWLQVLMLALQMVQFLAMIIAPPLAALINLAGLVLGFWLMTSFIAELHGFRSLLAVFAGIMLTSFLIAILLAVLIAMLLGPQVLANV